MSSLIGFLHRLLESNVKFEWCDGCEKAFRDVKTCIASDQVLTHYDPAMLLKLVSDPSNYGLGVVLRHVLPSGEEKPIALVSRSLSKVEKIYSQIDKEILSIVWGVQLYCIVLTLFGPSKIF